MPLFRKIIFTAFVVLAIGLGFWAYFNLKNNKKPQADALSVIPDQCLLYLHTRNFFDLDKKLNSQSLIVDKLKLFGDINRFCNTLRMFDSLFNSQPALRREVTDNSVHFAMYPEHLNWLAAFNIKQLGSQDNIREGISKLLNASAVGNDVYQFKLGKKGKLYFALRSGIVLISDTVPVIDRALNKTLKKLQGNPKFISFKATLAESSLFSVYVDHELYLKSRAAAWLNLPSVCKSGVSAGIIDIQPSQIKINGYLKPDSNDPVHYMAGQEPQPCDFTDALPLATSYFQAFGFNAFSKLKAQLFPASSKFWQSINDSALYNLEKDFYENIADYLIGFELDVPGQKFIMAGIADSVLAREHLKVMSDSVIRHNADSIFRIKTYGEAPGIFNPLLAGQTNYAMIFRSHIYFAAQAADLVQLLYALRSGLSMTDNESFAMYKSQNFPEAFNYLVYDSPSLRKNERHNFFNFKTNAVKDPFEDFKHFSFSITGQEDQFKFRWHLLNETANNKEKNILWTLQLDSNCVMKATGFVNHLTGENEMLVQDEGRQLYLVNAKGTVLWKKKLSEKIKSEIFMVDMFRNRKYQILFSSKNELHLIDRNGNYVQGYPVKLPSEATCALSLFDYDNTRDYRLFIACKNKQIYNYTISGARQQGFTNFRTENEVNLPVQYVKVGPSDYLVAVDAEGKIYTFSRKGEGRIGLKNRTTANCAAFYVDASANINSTYLVYADDKNSLINKISFDDKKSIIKLNYNIENAGISFCRAGDHKNMAVIFTKINALLAYDLNGNLLFNKSFDNDLQESDFYEDENRGVFLTRSAMRGELLVVDQLRQSTKSFKATALPLVSNLFNDNKKYLILTNGRQLSCISLD